MRVDELKKGLWGYKKDSVYDYIVSIEEKASERMAEKDARLEKLEAESKRQLARLEKDSKQQIGELETAVKALWEENEALRDNQADNDRQKQLAQEKFSADVRQWNQRLEEHIEQIRQIRAMIGEMLKDFDSRLESTEHALNHLPDYAPSAELDAVPAAPDEAEEEPWKKISFT